MAETLPTNVTSLAFYPLTAADAENPDRDGDGLTLAEELFVHGTDPTLADTSGDGISDGEAVRRGLDPRLRHVSDAEILARVAASATNESFAAATIVVTNSLASWKLFDGFAANVDAANGASAVNAGVTNGVAAADALAANGVYAMARNASKIPSDVIYFSVFLPWWSRRSGMSTLTRT